MAGASAPSAEFSPSAAADIGEGEANEMSPHTPWSKHVSFLPALGEEVRPEGHTILAVAAPNGENEWITTLYEQIKAVPGAGK